MVCRRRSTVQRLERGGIVIHFAGFLCGLFASRYSDIFSCRGSFEASEHQPEPGEFRFARTRARDCEGSARAPARVEPGKHARGEWSVIFKLERELRRAEERDSTASDFHAPIVCADDEKQDGRAEGSRQRHAASLCREFGAA